MNGVGGLSDFLQELEARKRTKPPRNPCLVGIALKGLTPQNADGLRKALKRDSGYSAQEIADVLKEHKIAELKLGLISNHRRGECNCVRD